MEKNEFIKSIRRKIERKKKELNLNSELLYLESLKKYVDLSDLKFPQKTKMSYPSKEDTNGRFKNVKGTSVKGIGACCHVYECILKEIGKGIISQIELDNSVQTPAEAINSYINKTINLNGINVRDCENDDIAYLVTSVINKKNKKFTQDDKSFLYFTIEGKPDKHYFANGSIIPKDIQGSYTSVSKSIYLCSVKDVYQLVAIPILADYVYKYTFSNKKIYETIISYIETVYDLSEEAKVEFKNLTKDDLISIVMDNDFKLPTIFRTFFAIATSVMLSDITEISNYQKRISELSGEYAKTYTTKKNIPKKILGFMNDNIFLNMFGFVEVDAESDLDKIKQLEKSFIDLSNQMPLVISKDHDLRFRKLGNVNRNPREKKFSRTGGVYYSGLNTLALDLDNMNSFIHEYFHLIDFTNDILSLNRNFDKIVNEYRFYMDKRVKSKGEDSDTYQEWFQYKSKYDRNYYRSRDEIFARAGEIYIQTILGIHTSFNHKNFDSERNEIIYPLEDNLLNAIKEYFDTLFIHIKNNSNLVCFNNPCKDDRINDECIEIYNLEQLPPSSNKIDSQLSIWDLMSS